MGLNAIGRAKRARIPLTYGAAFFLFAFVRNPLTESSFRTEIAPIEVAVVVLAGEGAAAQGVERTARRS